MTTSPKSSAPPVIRLGHPMAFCAVLRHVGAPVDRLLRRQGLPVLCDDPDAFVPLLRVWSFFEVAARLEGPSLPWLVGAYVGNHNLNVALLRQLEAAPTLLQALQRLVQMVRVEGSHLELGIHERRDDVLLYTRYSGMRETRGYLRSQAYQLGVLLDIIRHFLGRRWIPDEVGTECPHLPDGTQELFPGSRLLTQQPVGYIAVPRAHLHRAARRTDRNGDKAEDPVESASFDFVDTLRLMLEAYLSEGYPSARFAATLMDTSERTLVRKLSANGLTYGALVDEVRFTVAKERLQKPGARIGDVAQSVGFDDQSHFTRMFRRVGGLTPRQFRETMRL